MVLAVAGCDVVETSGAKKAVGELLKDPRSAQYEDVRKFGDYVCGRVNAKNSYGAYNGFRKFYVYLDTAHLEPEEPGVKLDQPGIGISDIEAWNAHIKFRVDYLTFCPSAR
ncbi:hypothetical protein ASD79_03425 [Caulobacter sp. Root655]|nr:hypothetical protein ASD79_03425 [Caulobacter sp. Root655]